MKRGPVPNQMPKREGSLRVALVGEAPGETECSMGYPFAGTAGWCLNTALSWAGLSREECFVGNVCQWKPSATSNEFDLLDWQGEEVQGGITQLLADLSTFRPNVVVCLGNVPLHLFKHGNVAPPRAGAKEGKVAAIKWPSKVSSWRGSLFLSSPLLSAACPGREAMDAENTPDEMRAGEAALSSVRDAEAMTDGIKGHDDIIARTGVCNSPDRDHFTCLPAPHEAPYNTPPRAGETLAADRGTESTSLPGVQEGLPRASAGAPSSLPLGIEEHIKISATEAARLLRDQPEHLKAMGWDLKEWAEAVERANLPAVPVLAEPAPRIIDGETPPVMGSEAQESTKAVRGAIGSAPTLAAAGSFPSAGWKCVATWHPAFVLRSWSSMFDLRQDLVRARLEASEPSLSLPRLVLEWGPDPLLNT